MLRLNQLNGFSRKGTTPTAQSVLGLWAFGVNYSGQIPDGTTPFILPSSPIQVGLETWTKVLHEFGYSFGIKTDGTLWFRGVAYAGSAITGMGASTRTIFATWTQVGALTDWADIATDGGSVLAIKTNGTLWAWGDNSSGTLGDGTIAPKSSPIQIGALNTWKNVWCRVATATATQTDNSMWVWGSNPFGSLGLGDATDRSSPVQLGTDTDYVKAVMGYGFTLFLKGASSPYSIFGTGLGTTGQLANNPAISVSSPIQVGLASVWTDVGTTGTQVAGSWAIKNTGQLWAWGDNTTGLLGLGTSGTIESSPVQVGALTNWSKVIGGTFISNFLALKTDATLWYTGQREDATNSSISSPIQVGTASNWTKLHSSSYFSKSDSILWGMGANAEGCFGYINWYERPTQVVSQASPNWTKVIVALDSFIGLKSDGTLWSWGPNTAGLCGQGDTVARSSPVQIGAATNWTDIKGCGSHAIGLRGGAIYCWGDNQFGQLGDSTLTTRSSPVQVGGLTTWTQIACLGNGGTSYGIKGGTLWAWGSGGAGQLGNNTVGTQESSPIQVGILATWTRLLETGADGSAATALAIQTGKLFGWGDNSGGWTGTGTSGNQLSSPVQVGILTTWAKVALVFGGALGVDTAGHLFVWGDNAPVSLGLAGNSSPVQVGSLTNWLTPIGGGTSSEYVVVKTDNTIWKWGATQIFGYGDGALSFVTQTSPVQIGTVAKYTWAATLGSTCTILVRTVA